MTSETRGAELPHIAATDPQVLAKERETLNALSQQGALTRFKGYWSLSGPGSSIPSATGSSWLVSFCFAT